jgi:D-serine deaminase-like pyridoxal phosphate-dependent protein
MYEATLQRETATTRSAGEPLAPEHGGDWAQLDTPALLVNLDRLDANIASMAGQSRRVGLALRPHFKTHKSTEIAKRQLAAGAVGITVAKLDEAEALILAGIEAPILVAYQIVAAPKLDRAIRLAANRPLTLAVDSADGATHLAGAAAAAGTTIDVWIEIDSGLRRCGILPGDAPALARRIVELDSLRLTGMFTHAGQSYGARDAREVEAIAAVETSAVVDAALATRALGIPIDTVSAGSTPTARFLDSASGLTEMRPGTYVFYDDLQVALGTIEGDRCALSVAATIVSRPARDRAVIDAGSKTFGLDRGAHSSSPLKEFGRVIDADAALVRLSEEHGVLDIPVDSTIAVGDRIRIVPNHACSVSNLGRRYYGLRGRVVEEVIQIEASGGVH